MTDSQKVDFKDVLDQAGGAHTETRVIVGPQQAAIGQLGPQGAGVEVADKKNLLGEKEVCGGTGRAVTLGVQVGNGLVALGTSPAQDDLLESIGDTRSGSVTRWLGGVDC